MYGAAYQFARNTYQRLWNRPHWRYRQSLVQQFRPWVRPGSLVFDVGANTGEYAEAFRALGARVVAVEPHPVLASRLRTHHHGLTVEPVAVGPAPGMQPLLLAHDTNHSTLSTGWAQHVPERFHASVSVQVTTLDALIATHGVPHLIKIDVEGFEAEVLAGLTTAVRVLVFEYQTALLSNTRRACEHLAQLDAYHFQVQGEAAQYWTPDAMVGYLATLPDGSGDIVASIVR